jgi:hypothetical protein
MLIIFLFVIEKLANGNLMQDNYELIAFSCFNTMI